MAYWQQVEMALFQFNGMEWNGIHLIYVAMHIVFIATHFNSIYNVENG